MLIKTAKTSANRKHLHLFQTRKVIVIAVGQAQNTAVNIFKKNDDFFL